MLQKIALTKILSFGMPVTIVPQKYGATMRKTTDFIRGEPWQARHNRRLAASIDFQKDARSWCSNRGIDFTVSEDDEVWTFSQGNRKIRWFPKTAKLTIGRKSTHHVQDWYGVISYLVNTFCKNA